MTSAEVAIKTLQDQRNAALDTIVNLQIHMNELQLQLDAMKMDTVDPYKPEIPEGVVA